jgi:hypothetical protein
MSTPLFDCQTEADPHAAMSCCASSPSRTRASGIITLDESLVYFGADHDLRWTIPEEIVPDRERHTYPSPKCMLTIVWNPSGFHVLKALPKGEKFNAR